MVARQTGPADREAFERHVVDWYAVAGLPPPRVVWASSPLVLAYAATSATAIHEVRRFGQLGDRTSTALVLRGAQTAPYSFGLARPMRAFAGAGRGAQAPLRARGGRTSQAPRVAVVPASWGRLGEAVPRVEAAVAEATEGISPNPAARGVVRELAGIGARVGASIVQVFGHIAVEGVERATTEERHPFHEAAVERASEHLHRSSWDGIFPGQFWLANWRWGAAPVVDFFREVCGLRLGRGLDELAQACLGATRSACWWYPHTEFVLACERPASMTFDGAGLLHGEGKPAVVWPDGWGFHRLHGVRVPDGVAMHPEKMTARQIDAEENAEVRRVMMETFGLGRYMVDSGARKIHEDAFGTLYEKPGVWPASQTSSFLLAGSPIRGRQRGRELAVHVRNATVEPDGSVHEFWLRVHPELRPMLPGDRLGEPQGLTAKNAVASTFGMTGDEYEPEYES